MLTLWSPPPLFTVPVYQWERDTGRRIPIMVSGTIVDMSGRTLSGQTTEAFYARYAKA